MVVEIFLQNRKKKKQNWEDTNQEVTEKSHRKREIQHNKEKGEDYKWCHMKAGEDETETNAHVIERKQKGKW